MKKIAVANDISGAGRCSLTADLPVISALGVQCCPLVTSVFSAQTGYGSYHVRDLSGDIMPTVEDWSAKGFLFDAVLTGFIASSESGKEIIWAAKTLKKSDTLLVVDPVMGDDGELYPCADDAVREQISALADMADVITPNLTELCILAGEACHPLFEMSFEERLRHVEQLSAEIAGEKKIVLTTGIDAPEGEIAVGVYCRGKFRVLKSKRYGGSFSGTGDLFASIVAAQAVKGVEIGLAARQAIDFIGNCVKTTLEEDPFCDRNDGVLFEKHLRELTEI